MRRMIWAAFVLLLTAGASPHRSLPVPPIPPADPPSGQSAPLPDRDMQPPLDATSQGARVSVEDFRIRRFYPGLAYSPGSHFETSEEKRPIQTPGLAVQVPLR